MAKFKLSFLGLILAAAALLLEARGG